MNKEHIEYHVSSPYSGGVITSKKEDALEDMERLSEDGQMITVTEVRSRVIAKKQVVKNCPHNIRAGDKVKLLEPVKDSYCETVMSAGMVYEVDYVANDNEYIVISGYGVHYKKMMLVEKGNT